MTIQMTGFRAGAIGWIRKGLLILFFGLSITSWGKDYRTFTSNDGKSINGRIVKYDASRGMVFFERDNNVQMWISPDVFCKEDQGYISEWIQADYFLSESKLCFSLSKNGKKSMGSKKELRKFETFYFDLTIRNTSETQITGLKVEYRYFINTTVYTWNNKTTSCNSILGKLEPISIAPRKTVKYQTPDIVLDEIYVVKEQVDRWRNNPGETGPATVETSNYYFKETSQDFKGVWIRIYGPLVGGVPSVRDICVPSSLMDQFEWDGSVAKKK